MIFFDACVNDNDDEMFELWRGWLEHARVTDVASDEESGAQPLLTERDAFNSQSKKSTQLSEEEINSTLRGRNQLNSKRKKSTQL